MVEEPPFLGQPLTSTSDWDELDWEALVNQIAALDDERAPDPLAPRTGCRL